MVENNSGAGEISCFPAAFSSTLLILAILPWPYGYYTFLRLVICLSAAYLAFNAYALGKAGWQWSLAAIALLFNPLIPIQLGDRVLWVVIDIALVPVFGLSMLYVRRSPPR